MAILRYYWFTVVLTVASLVFVYQHYGQGAAGRSAVVTVVIVLVVEWALSFDNAIVNVKILERMSTFWQKMFLTVGLVMAVGIVRFLLPIGIVMVSVNMDFMSVLRMAVNDPAEYGEVVLAAHALIATFGGSYLYLLATTFFFDDSRDMQWIGGVERWLVRFGAVRGLKYGTVIAYTVVMATMFGHGHGQQILMAGLLATALFYMLELVTEHFDRKDSLGAGAAKTVQTGFAAFALFMYLQVLDSSFSLDGVVGAFAISSDIVLNSIGLALGALAVRTMTIHLLHTQALTSLRYVEHGAHWAIASLALCMLVSVTGVEVPEYVTGGLSVTLIGASVLWSVRANRRYQLCGSEV